MLLSTSIKIPREPDGYNTTRERLEIKISVSLYYIILNVSSM